MITAGTWYFLAHSWMADGMMYSWPWLLIRICLRNPAFQYPVTIERTSAEVRSSGMGTVPVCPRWANGCDAYQSGSATVQPVFWAIISHIRVTINTSSPKGCASPWFSVEPNGISRMSLTFNRSSMSFFVIVW